MNQFRDDALALRGLTQTIVLPDASPHANDGIRHRMCEIIRSLEPL